MKILLSNYRNKEYLIYLIITHTLELSNLSIEPFLGFQPVLESDTKKSKASRKFFIVFVFKLYFNPI